MKQRNCSIDIFRYICALMVVAIHTHPFMDVNKDLGFVFTHMVTRLGVPFFFGVAGYFYIGKLESGKKPLWPYLKRLLLTYGLWTLIYYTLDFVQFGHKNIGEFLLKCIYKFFVPGSRGHFWFFPSLIVAVCATTGLYRLRCKKIIVPFGILLYLVGCLGSAYYKVSPVWIQDLVALEHYEILRRMVFIGFPFFGCGLLIHWLHKRNIRWIGWLWLCTTVLWLGEILVVKYAKLQRDVATTPLLYVQLAVTVAALLQKPMSRFEKLADRCRVCANFTYYSHPFVIIVINLVSQKLMKMHFTETPMFVITVCLCGIAALIIHKINNKYINYLV